MKARVTKKGDAIATLKNFAGRVSGAHVKVGVLAGNEPRREGDPITNAELATIHEFGAPGAGIPERPFIRPGVSNAVPKIKALVRANIGPMFLGKVSQDTVLKKVGLLATSEIKAMFTNNSWAPNAPGTVAQKGSSRPLIDTGQLRASVSYEIVRGAP